MNLHRWLSRFQINKKGRSLQRRPNMLNTLVAFRVELMLTISLENVFTIGWGQKINACDEAQRL